MWSLSVDVSESCIHTVANGNISMKNVFCCLRHRHLARTSNKNSTVKYLHSMQYRFRWFASAADTAHASSTHFIGPILHCASVRDAHPMRSPFDPQHIPNRCRSARFLMASISFILRGYFVHGGINRGFQRRVHRRSTAHWRCDAAMPIRWLAGIGFRRLLFVRCL